MRGPEIDWSGNCGNLTAAVGPFAIERGRVACPKDGVAMVLVEAAALGADCGAYQAQLNRDPALLARCEALRIAGALAMGLAGSADEAAARVPGALAARRLQGATTGLLRIGHPSGRVEVGVSADHHEDVWRLDSAAMTRSARLLMDGWVSVAGLRA